MIASEEGISPTLPCNELVEEQNRHSPRSIRYAYEDDRLSSGASVEDRLIGERYQLDVTLGAGGMGTVWRACDTRLDRPVAVKLINLTSQPADMQRRSRFAREARIAANLHHQNIVSIYDYGFHVRNSGHDIPFVVMELVDGVPLSSLLGPSNMLNVSDVCGWGVQICRALSMAHRAGVVHRDIKPANVILTKNPEMEDVVKLVDFGIAAYTSSERTRITTDGQVVGSPAYMSPEQAQGTGQLDGRSDLYSVGCLLYALLAGRPPFAADDIWELLRAHREELPQSLSGYRRDVPADLGQLISQMLSKEADQRPQGASEVGEALLRFTSQGAASRRQGEGLPPGGRGKTPPTGDEVARHAEAGEYRLAAELAGEVARQCARDLGADHVQTLAYRHQEAEYRCMAAQLVESVRISEDVSQCRGRVLGSSHPEALNSRALHIWCLAEVGDYPKAAHLVGTLIQDCMLALPSDHPVVLRSRALSALCGAHVGNPAQAIRLLSEVVSDHVRVFGVDHPESLRCRWFLAESLIAAEDFGEAASHLDELIQDQQRILGPHHPETFESRAAHIMCLAASGAAATSDELARDLVHACEGVQGSEAPVSILCQISYAVALAACGKTEMAMQVSGEVVRRCTYALGPDHLHSFYARFMEAAVLATGNGNELAVRRRLAELGADQARVLGADHPATLTSRHALAETLAGQGHFDEAAPIYAEVAAARARVLSPEYPDTLTSRHGYAVCIGALGEYGEAVRLSAEVAAVRARVLGPEHPDTLSSRHDYAFYLGESGEHGEAVRLSAEVAAVRARVLGPEHPDTLTSRSNHAAFLGRLGEYGEAVRLSAEVAAVRARVLGPEHPDTLSS
ncbi:tetratricopeptide repeat protein, partial [Streptomyces collinus]|uniref:serine/threonine-protein kinase n=1 Tax=Streptomyces collinus TaxID=42684 RepID=UPI00368129FB